MMIESLKRYWWVPVVRSILMGLISIVFATLLLWNPVAGAAVLIWLTAWYATVFGVLAIIFGIRLRGLRGTPAPL
jgi:uncharacterized membrane protein HdeD (DUF308 family)